MEPLVAREERCYKDTLVPEIIMWLCWWRLPLFLPLSFSPSHSATHPSSHLRIYISDTLLSLRSSFQGISRLCLFPSPDRSSFSRSEPSTQITHYSSLDVVQILRLCLKMSGTQIQFALWLDCAWKKNKIKNPDNLTQFPFNGKHISILHKPAESHSPTKHPLPSENISCSFICSEGDSALH